MNTHFQLHERFRLREEVRVYSDFCSKFKMGLFSLILLTALFAYTISGETSSIKLIKKILGLLF